MLFMSTPRVSSQVIFRCALVERTSAEYAQKDPRNMPTVTSTLSTMQMDVCLFVCGKNYLFLK